MNMAILLFPNLNNLLVIPLMSFLAKENEICVLASHLESPIELLVFMGCFLVSFFVCVIGLWVRLLWGFFFCFFSRIPQKWGCALITTAYCVLAWIPQQEKAFTSSLFIYATISLYLHWPMPSHFSLWVNLLLFSFYSVGSSTDFYLSDFLGSFSSFSAPTLESDSGGSGRLLLVQNSIQIGSMDSRCACYCGGLLFLSALSRQS